MMKKTLKMMVMALVAMSMVALTGCKKDEEKSFKEMVPGSWIQASVTTDGQTRGEDETMFYVFNADGTGDLEFCGIQGVNLFTWKIDGDKLTMELVHPDYDCPEWVYTIESMSETQWVIKGKTIPLVSNVYNSVTMTLKKSKYKHYNDQFNW